MNVNFHYLILNVSCSQQDFTRAYQEYNEEFEKASHMKRKVEEKRAINNIVYEVFYIFFVLKYPILKISLLFKHYRSWIHENSELAKEKYESTKATRDHVQSLTQDLCKTYGIKEVGKAIIN